MKKDESRNPSDVAIIVTTIAQPNSIMQELAKGCKENDFKFIVVGDVASPPDFNLSGCDYYSVEKQKLTGLKFAQHCPVKHYARKNIGYLIAMSQGVSIIRETDDDNLPLEGFWEVSSRMVSSQLVDKTGWVNVYSYFTDSHIWPRGLPLEDIKRASIKQQSTKTIRLDCPIHQGLQNEHPDVDAVYCMIGTFPISFEKNHSIALGKDAWSPFNSQNTTWWKDAFPLMYLPATCSFRMTDIWRSFVAQRIAWANDWHVAFSGATVVHQRNQHHYYSDFKQEISGYLGNNGIRTLLNAVPVKRGVQFHQENLKMCYERLVEHGYLDLLELKLLDSWSLDIESITKGNAVSKSIMSSN